MRKRDAGVDVALPITPMLDMSFQLLAFFILTFHPMAAEGQLAAQMPAVAANAIPQDPQDVDMPKDEYTITAYSADGELAGLSLRGPTVTQSDIRTLRELQQMLENVPKPGKNHDSVNMTIEASNDLAYSRLIDVINLCKKAGFESINLSPIRRGPMS